MNKIEKQKLKKYQQQIYGNPNWIDGRINRAEYFVRCFLIRLTGTLMTVGAVYGAMMQSTFGYAILAICGFMAIWMIWRLIMTYVKRAHDLGWSGWIGAPIVFLHEIVNIKELEMPKTPKMILFIFTLIISLIFLFKRGTKGVNKYGKDPLTKYEELA